MVNDRWIKIWYTYTMEYYSAIKKNEIMLYSNMDGLRDDHTKTKEKDKYHVISPICGI